MHCNTYQSIPTSDLWLNCQLIAVTFIAMSLQLATALCHIYIVIVIVEFLPISIYKLNMGNYIVAGLTAHMHIQK